MMRARARGWITGLCALTLLLAACASTAMPTLPPAPTDPGAGAPTLAPEDSLGVEEPLDLGPGATDLPAVDTAGWVRLEMPWLGYSLQLPPTWERVGPDTDDPVPSAVDIGERDPDTGIDLQQAAQQVAAAGLFEPMGLWAVDPASLMQVGLVAGAPYRIGADELEGVVGDSVVARASDLADPVLTPVELPMGTGFLAVYLDVADLSEHREVHLRTPAGRYLVLASTYPGLAEPELAADILAVARSIEPLAGDRSGERPAPSARPSGDADPELAALLPQRLGDATLIVRSVGGEDLVGDGITAGGTLAGGLGELVDAPGDVSLGLAVPAGSSEAPILVAAFRLRGVPVADVDAWLADFPGQIWSRETIEGKEVLGSVTDPDGRRTVLRTGSLAGDSVLFQVESSDPELTKAAIAALP
jgi:hypothetical protein